MKLLYEMERCAADGNTADYDTLFTFPTVLRRRITEWYMLANGVGWEEDELVEACSRQEATTMVRTGG